MQAGLAALVKVTATNGAILRFPTDQHWMAAPEVKLQLAAGQSRCGPAR